LNFKATAEATTMTGDMYVFAFSWTPEFCRGKTYPGCSQPQSYWKSYFTVHGLWPQYSTGGYPHDCTTTAYDNSVANKVGWSDMTKYWPNVQEAENSTNYQSFWQHEWSKHGTCTGLSQYDYMSKTLGLAKSFPTPASVTKAVGGTISASSLRNDFGGASKVALQCDGGNYLSGAYTCWSQSSGTPKSQIACPSDVVKEDTCTASTLNVPKL
jgi:ribonuclease T2